MDFDEIKKKVSELSEREISHLYNTSISNVHDILSEKI